MRQRTNRILAAVAVGASTSLIVAAVATAATIVGTDKSETLNGTNGADRIDAKGGTTP